jgi:large subunit ribosomal protein L2
MMSVVTYKGVITATEPHKALTFGRAKHAGRNNRGIVTVPHQGGGNKNLYRMVDFKFNKKNIPAKVETIEYDPNRTAFIALICYNDGERRYMLVPATVTVGDVITVAADAPLKPGNRLPLRSIPVGTFIYNIELYPDAGAKLVRSAGNFAQVNAHDNGKVHLKLPSGEIRTVSDTCWASIGTVSNGEHQLVNRGKAGKSRWLGIRPTVRGTAMNPVDHPHGGGEGVQGIGLRRGPKTRHGKQAYGVKTRRPKKYSNYAIITRRKTKRNTPN